MVAMPGGPLGGVPALGAIRWMVEQFRLLPLGRTHGNHPIDAAMRAVVAWMATVSAMCTPYPPPM
ncbi:MAG: hypothetical protein ACJ8AD_17545, partial [Gemmatimonadaceae bacterium]